MVKPCVEGDIVAGVDEAGRGPLAGPVVAAAVILDIKNPISRLDDSKRLTVLQRTKLAVEIKEKAISWSIGRVNHEEIDRINILEASLLAMKLAIENLGLIPGHILVDGDKCPNVPYRIDAIIGGDRIVPTISAASILAKVARDEEMIRLDAVYPGYGFARHKGYPTSSHLKAIELLGVCEIHRRSYAPIKRLI